MLDEKSQQKADAQPAERSGKMTHSEHIETRRKLRSIYDVSTFEQLVESCVLTDEDKSILRLHYLKGKDFRFIGNALGFSEVTIKRRHRKILSKLNKMF